jgi:Protein of unknown function (DUF4245)
VLNRVLHGGLAALGCVLGAAVLVVAIPVPHAAQPVAISYRGDQAALARLAPYPAVAPAGLPASWTPVSSDLTTGGPVSGTAGAGTVTWALGYATPDGALVSLEETNASAAPFVRRMTNNGTVLLPAQPPPAGPGGRAWTFSATPARGQRSMYATSPAGFTVVVTGSATWADLRLLAASLRPVAAGG